MPGSRAPSDARTQRALGLGSPGATEDAAARRVIAGRAPPNVAGRPTKPEPPRRSSRTRWARAGFDLDGGSSVFLHDRGLRRANLPVPPDPLHRSATRTG